MYTVSRSALEEACYAAGLEPEQAIRTRYSGRMMFGKECLGIVHDTPGEMLEFAASLMNDSADARKWLKGARNDAMGLSQITYWPGVEVTD